MGYTTSTVHGIEVPDSSEANNVPEDIGKVVTALEAGSLAKRLTGAQISALTVPQKPAGLLVYNTTTSKLQISDGTNFANFVTSQSGTVASAAGGYVDITFSPAFPAAPVVVVTANASGTFGSPGYLYVTSVTTTGARIYGLSLSMGCNWLAVAA